MRHATFVIAPVVLATVIGIVPGAWANSISVTVPATKVVQLAGQPDGVSFYGSTAPADSPVAIDLTAFLGQYITFAVSGTTSRDPNLSSFPLVGGDGETPGTSSNAAPDFSTPPVFDLSGMVAPLSSLLGVFLDVNQIHSVPSTLDFGTTLARSFTTLSPEIQQLFFIGDGLTGIGTGSVQTFRIPSGADFLYLGTYDVGSANNQGSLNVTIMDVVPEPTSLLLLGTGLGVLGFAAWRRKK